MDERMMLSPGLADEIVAVAREGANTAIRGLFAKRQAEAKAALVAQQKAKLSTKLLPDGEQRTEVYPIKVIHKGTRIGVNTEISIEGCDTWFCVEQSHSYPARTWGGKKSLSKAQWDVKLMVSGVAQSYERTDNLESAVQQCIVALLGHVWYGNR